MKNLSYLLFIALAVLVVSCDKNLDVTPQQNITPEQITTSADVQALVSGEYSLFQSANGYGERLKFIPDLLAAQDQLDFVGTFTGYKDIYNKQQVVLSTIASGIWANGYRIINLTNTALAKIDLVTDDKDITTGEAEFMRGVILFEMVNLYARTYTDGDASQNLGIPVVLSAPQYIYDSTSALLPRSTVQQVYTQVLSDLMAAADKLPETADNARVTKYSAEAMLSRVYMMMGDYENAATMANDVINSGYFNLVSTFNQEFNNVGNSTEDIWGIQQTAQSNAGVSNSGLTTFYASYPVGRGDVQVDAGFPGHFDDNNDFRKYYYSEGFSISGIDGNYTNKWAQLYKTVPVVRLAEMYLTRGEANLRKGGAPVGDDPLNDINIVRARAGASAYNAVSADNFIEERFRELTFEGDRVWTLKRLHLDIDGLSFNDNFLILPIPQRETDVNKNLVQNDGY